MKKNVVLFTFSLIAILLSSCSSNVDNKILGEVPSIVKSYESKIVDARDKYQKSNIRKRDHDSRRKNIWVY